MRRKPSVSKNRFSVDCLFPVSTLPTGQESGWSLTPICAVKRKDSKLSTNNTTFSSPKESPESCTRVIRLTDMSRELTVNLFYRQPLTDRQNILLTITRQGRTSQL